MVYHAFARTCLSSEALGSNQANALFAIDPYRENRAWVFDDPKVGLVREPFVAGIDRMIDRLVEAIPDAGKGSRLLFGLTPFEGFQSALTWIRSDPVEGNWYRADGSDEEGWLCPALFCYFSTPPSKIYVRAEPKVGLAK